MGLVAGLAVGVAAVGSAGASFAAGDQPRSQLSSFDCHNALDPPDRTVSVKAVMRPLDGTQKLQLKFDLLVGQDGSQSTSAVRAGNLGTWLAPRSATLGRLAGDVWKFEKSVVELDAPDTYQFRVSFRWVGAHGHVLGTVVRYSRRCHQRELRPDLQVSPITVSSVAGMPTHDRYSAVIRNGGATAAGPFVVQFVPGAGSSAQPQQRTIQRLDRYTNRTVSFVGPLCSAAGPPTITADSTLQVDDVDRSNNSSAAVCPAAGSS
ncbi:MAG TPA: hypothetical protein VGL51_12935 [Solirubrobacteraceae bacterium]